MKKIQKKYYLSEDIAKRLKLASAHSGFSQSAILEAVLTLDLVRRAMKRR